MQVERVTPV